MCTDNVWSAFDRHTILIDPYTNATLFNVTSISATVRTYKDAVSETMWSTEIGKGGVCDANVAENAQAPLKCTGNVSKKERNIIFW